MKRIVYPNEFNELFSAFDEKLGPIGGKYKAFEYFQKWKITAEDLPEIINALQRQQVSYYKRKAAGVWLPPFRNAKTWINQRGWEDEIEQQLDAPDTIMRLTNRDWAH